MIDSLDARRERPAVRCLPQRCDRASDRRGAVALGAGGQELGMELVEPRDRVAEVGSNSLEALAPALAVDLDYPDLVALVGADVEPAGHEAIGGPRAPRQHQLAERRQRLAPVTEAFRLEERSPVREHALQTEPVTGGVVHVLHR